MTTITTCNNNTEGDTVTLDEAEENEDPSLSSASLCIKFHMPGVNAINGNNDSDATASFHPVFTHQAFPGEWIRGYHPPLQTLLTKMEEAKQKSKNNSNTNSNIDQSMLLHSSYKHHESATKELSVNVTLAPSCQNCHVELGVQKKQLPRQQILRHSKRLSPPHNNDDNDNREEKENYHDNNKYQQAHSSDNQKKEKEEVSPAKKKRKINIEDDDEDSEGWNDEEEDIEDEEDSEFEDEDDGSEIDLEQNDKEGSTRASRMETNEILQSLTKGLPSMVKEVIPNDDYLRRPLGTELKEYQRKDMEFVLCLAKGKAVVDYHNQVQKLALWFIETADDVDVASEDGGFWNVLYLLRKHKRTQYSLAGFVTLFHFNAPFHKPTPGMVVRVCQALILPPYQRSGHGREMLSCVMDIAHGVYQHELESFGNHKEIVEINVEDPAPAFVMLRNRADYDCLLRSQQAKDPWIASEKFWNGKVTDDNYFQSISEAEVIEASAKAKIIPRQIHIVQELYKLQQLQDHLEHSSGDREALEKKFRLMIKKRLNKEHREDLSGLRTKAEKQAFLEDEFKKCLESYVSILPKKPKA